MQRDGHRFDHKTLESIRLMAVERVRDGERASTEGRQTLHFLPGYAPELNPDELVWSHVKRTGISRMPLRKGEKLSEKI
jgi:transposase